ncbi:MAG: c-type cytochrome [Planctomycetota bacterium]
MSHFVSWPCFADVRSDSSPPAQRRAPLEYVLIDWNAPWLATSGLGIVERDSDETEDFQTTLPIDNRVWSKQDIPGSLRTLGIPESMTTSGTFLIGNPQHAIALYGVTVTREAGGRYVVLAADKYGSGTYHAFELLGQRLSYSAEARIAHVSGRLSATDELIRRMFPGRDADAVRAGWKDTGPAGWGYLSLSAALHGVTTYDTPTGEGGTASVAGSIGPDVIVGNIHDWKAWGAIGGLSAFSLGTISCNAGDEPLNWYANTDQHPVIAQNMYRLKDGRFEQIGQSWVKHGFSALTGDECDFGCVPPPGGPQQLGVGCSDPYSANLNGTQFYLGPRSGVNAYTGQFEYPWSAPPANAITGRRIQVWNTDLHPTQNQGAKWFGEAQYVTPDDAAAGNQNNNVSYRQMIVFVDGDTFSFAFPGTVSREQPAIRAWKEEDPEVTLNGTSTVGDGLFWIGSRATALGGGWWNYEFAVYNQTSHRSAQSFSVPMPGGVSVENIGFNDIDYHSGEPYSPIDWTASIEDGAITWSGETFFENEDANALRWGTLYNFRFDADTPPVQGIVTIGYFRPGSAPTTGTFAQIPSTPIPVCGDEYVAVGEECDPPDGVHCDEECQWICGDGVIQSGEECDPPDGVDCDSNCEIIYICGDGVVDPGEECDPPNGVTCDADCIRIPICGDFILDPGESCDPPNGATCDDQCMTIDNDDCVSAQSICPGVYDQALIASTNDGSASCDTTPGTQDHWFKYTPLTDGVLTIDTCGSDLDSVLSVHTSCSELPQDELACNDDSCNVQSALSLPVTGGTEYLIRVAGAGGDSGDYRLTADGPACQTGPPPNDDCTYLVALAEGQTTFTTNQADTDGPDEPTACATLSGTNLQSDAWFCYQASCTGTAEFSVCDSDFDPALAIYSGCTCPDAASATHCVAGDCGTTPSLSMPVVAGQSFLVRVGSPAGQSGIGTLGVACRGSGDGLRGGQLYDNWWIAASVTEPEGEHPLYPDGAPQQGSATFRCQECHGWDYKGADGVYGTGEHFTGIGGVLNTSLSPDDLFDLLRGDIVENGHNFETMGLNHQDVWDLVEFVSTLLLDTDDYIDGGNAFIGDPVQGQVHFTSGGMIPCIVCHGPDGTNINFGTPSEPRWLGTVAFYNPWKLMHKVRFGQPGAAMPSWLEGGGDAQGAADIGRYAQATFPVDCLNTTQCEDNLFCTGVESCADGFCVANDVPCEGQVCDETLPGCISGTCDMPVVEVSGSRSVTVTPAAGIDPVAIWFAGISEDPDVSCSSWYVQADGRLDLFPVFQTPASWGSVRVSDVELLPESTFAIRADCGIPGASDFSFGQLATAWVYGDVDQNGVANFSDILAIVRGFQGTFDYPLEALDIAPCAPDGLVNFTDILVAVLAFQGVNADCPVPCP